MDPHFYQNPLYLKLKIKAFLLLETSQVTYRHVNKKYGCILILRFSSSSISEMLKQLDLNETSLLFKI